MIVYKGDGKTEPVKRDGKSEKYTIDSEHPDAELDF